MNENESIESLNILYTISERVININAMLERKARVIIHKKKGGVKYFFPSFFLSFSLFFDLILNKKKSDSQHRERTRDIAKIGSPQ